MSVDEGNKLLSNPDAMFWAEEFIRIRREVLEERNEDIADDAGVMVGWFANAMAVGETSSPLFKEHVRELVERLGIGDERGTTG